jgi:hypothetical protein
MTPFRSLFLRGSCAALLVSFGVGAGGADGPDGGGDSPSLGEARLILTDVPDDLGCVRVTAAGPGRTTVRELVPEASTMQTTLTGLPVGSVAFTGEAFTAACPSVTARTAPLWVSEPVTAAIAPGRLATVALVMHLNGRAKVSVRFDDERCGDGGCGDDGGR